MKIVLADKNEDLDGMEQEVTFDFIPNLFMGYEARSVTILVTDSQGSEFSLTVDRNELKTILKAL